MGSCYSKKGFRALKKKFFIVRKIVVESGTMKAKTNLKEKNLKVDYKLSFYRFPQGRKNVEFERVTID